MNIQDLRLLYDYHYWAKHHLLSFCKKLTHAQLIAPNTFSNGNLKATLVHLMSAEWIWLQRCRDGVSPPAMLNDADYPTLTDVIKRWDDEEAQFQTWLATLSDSDVQGDIHYATQNGIPFTTPLWHILTHVITHGMQHNSEIAQMLTDFGHSPGNIDLIVYLRSYRAAK